MPELPEVETVRRLLERRLVGMVIADAAILNDPLVFRGLRPDVIREAMVGTTVVAVGRKGKYWWLELDRRPWLLGHLGMSGWIREIPKPSASAPQYTRMILKSRDGKQLAFTDPRRFGRIWLAEDAESDPRIAALGADAWRDLASASELASTLARRRAPIKGVLLDQRVFAGVGNWIADEALYQARLRPARAASSLALEEIERLREALWTILDTAISVRADKRRFPRSWLFHKRWQRGKQLPTIDGREIRRETIAGRTCAWVPGVQS